MAGYEPSKGYYDSLGKAHCTSRGQFRCDTFVYYLFGWGGYNLPVSTVINPSRVFESFPKGNGDGPYAPELRTNTSFPNESTRIGLGEFSNIELSGMPINDFYNLVDIPNYKVDKDMEYRLLELAINNNLLSSSKRSIILDKISFIGNIESVSDLLNLVRGLKDKHASLKNQVIITVQHIIDNKCGKFVSRKCIAAKNELLLFYNDIVQNNSNVSPLSANIVVKGLISLSKENEIVKDHKKINSFIDAKNLNLDARSKLILKLDLLNVSDSLESTYLPEIISLLNNENDPDLDGTFNRYIVGRLSTINGGFSPEVKEQIRLYLESIKSKHDHVETNRISLLET